MSSQHSAAARLTGACAVFDAFPLADRRGWGQVYVRGLLLDSRRESVEPMAAGLGGPRPRSAGCWSCRPAGTRHRRRRMRPRSLAAAAAASPPRRDTWRSAGRPWT
ncbi:transposase [Streptomyces sp. NPDC006527]|uniref:transposase n=1 Tax=Streptomyces sp. NPDC006527 TaxID=3364749 RepID=UPI0036C7110C